MSIPYEGSAREMAKSFFTGEFIDVWLITRAKCTYFALSSVWINYRTDQRHWCDVTACLPAHSVIAFGRDEWYVVLHGHIQWPLTYASVVYFPRRAEYTVALGRDAKDCQPAVRAVVSTISIQWLLSTKHLLRVLCGSYVSASKLVCHISRRCRH